MKACSEPEKRLSVKFFLVALICSVTGIALSFALSFFFAALLNAFDKTGIVFLYRVIAVLLLFSGGIVTGELLTGVTKVRGVTCGMIGGIFSCTLLYLLQLFSSDILFSAGWFFFECLIIAVSCMLGAILKAVKR